MKEESRANVAARDRRGGVDCRRSVSDAPGGGLMPARLVVLVALLALAQPPRAVDHGLGSLAGKGQAIPAGQREFPRLTGPYHRFDCGPRAERRVHTRRPRVLLHGPDGRYLFVTRGGDIFWVNASVIEDAKRRAQAEAR
jgi:hypothetical protein